MEETSSRECALIAARAADERKATDIMFIKVGDLVDVTDYFVIATGANTPQVEAILDNIEEKVRIEGGVTPQGFQTIEITRFGLEHIHYELAVIEKLPRMIVGLLAGNGLHAALDTHFFLVISIVWKPCGVTPLLSISPKRASSIPNTASVLLSWLGT